MTASSNLEQAPAKINLALQILGRRDDGYHELDSLVAFVKDGDLLEGERTDGPLSLRITGEFSPAIPSLEHNLVIRAAELLRLHTGVQSGARLLLHKRLPVGAGLAGGSADAAAALRLLNRLWELDFTLDELAEMGLELGSDVPACVMGVPTRMQGAGEVLSPLAAFPSDMHCLLAYPGEPLLTADVYRALPQEDYSGELPAFPAIEGDFGYWKMWLEYTRNDLQPTAERLNPTIEPLLQWLAEQPGSAFTRMSGSGSACFALFADEAGAAAAKQAIHQHFPQAWALQTQIALAAGS